MFSRGSHADPRTSPGAGHKVAPPPRVAVRCPYDGEGLLGDADQCDRRFRRETGLRLRKLHAAMDRRPRAAVADQTAERGEQSDIMPIINIIACRRGVARRQAAFDRLSMRARR
jgi:hypothetical protein